MHFAKLDENNIVTEVIVADQNFIDSQIGTFVQTDVNGISPKNYAGIGFSYRADLGGFVPPKPYPSWILNESICNYDPPIAEPVDGHKHAWNEDAQRWDAL